MAVMFVATAYFHTIWGEGADDGADCRGYAIRGAALYRNRRSVHVTNTLHLQVYAPPKFLLN